MKILVACEFSGIVRDAFRALGHDAWSCDILPCESDSRWHIQGDVLEVLNDDWDLMVAHPPCTYLSNSGVRHLHDSVKSVNGVKAKIHSDRMFEMWKAAAFFNAFKTSNVPKIAIENPTPHKYARALIGRYQQAIQPYEFGEPETKRTCLWLKGLPPLMATIIETVRHPRCHLMSPGPNRSKERSRTLPGIAKAMSLQWGNA